MAVLVTGGTGFIGAQVCKRLAAEGADVVTYDVVPGSGLLDLTLAPEERAHITVETGDLRDMPRLARVTRAYEVDRIVHLAYMTTAPTKSNQWLAQEVNIEGTNNIFELAIGLDAKVVWASTIDVFGPKSIGADGAVANDAAYDPQGIYGACKLLNEVAARDYAKTDGLEAVAIRIPASFGPGITNSWVRFVPQMIKDFVDGRPARKPPVANVMPWIYVEDIADAFVRAFSFDADENVRGYTLPGVGLGSDEVIQMICDLFPGQPTEAIEWREFGSMPSYDGQPLCDYLQWQPRYSVEAGLDRIRSYYQNEKDGLPPPAYERQLNNW